MNSAERRALRHKILRSWQPGDTADTVAARLDVFPGLVHQLVHLSRFGVQSLELAGWDDSDAIARSLDLPIGFVNWALAGITIEVVRVVRKRPAA